MTDSTFLDIQSKLIKLVHPQQISTLREKGAESGGFREEDGRAAERLNIRQVRFFFAKSAKVTKRREVNK